MIRDIHEMLVAATENKRWLNERRYGRAAFEAYRRELEGDIFPCWHALTANQQDAWVAAALAAKAMFR